MLLNRLEYALMNNPIRAGLQRHVEARRLLRLGGAMTGGRALELGCGNGVGVELIFELFGAESVDAFDLDPRMIALARQRLSRYGSRVRLWVGDASAISTRDAAYDAVVDFGILHHVPDWRRALAEVSRVLRPGGRFYAEEVLKPVLVHPVIRRVFKHPEHDRFDSTGFQRALRESGLESVIAEDVFNAFAWFCARKTALRATRVSPLVAIRNE